MPFPDRYFHNKTVVSLSPFNYSKVTSWVIWRISYIVALLKKNTKLWAEIMRGHKETLPSAHLTDYLYIGSQNKYIHLFDPRIIYFIILLTRKNTIVLYSHTLWSGLYALFLKIFFKVSFIFDNHNVEFDRFKTCKSYFSWLIFLFEYVLIYMSDYTSVCSQQDKDRIKFLYWLENVFVTLNDFSKRAQISPTNRSLFFKNLNVDPNKKIILFFGSFDYYPNLEALSFIEREIALYLNKDIFHIVIAWKWSEKLKKNLPQMTYLWFVDNIDELISLCDLNIAPIFSGGGVKIKILHAISLHVPIITTEEGMRGIDPNSKCIIARQDNFLEQIISFFLT